MGLGANALSVTEIFSQAFKEHSAKEEWYRCQYAAASLVPHFTPASWTQGRTALPEMSWSLPGLPGCLSVHTGMGSSRGHLGSQHGVPGAETGRRRHSRPGFATLHSFAMTCPSLYNGWEDIFEQDMWSFRAASLLYPRGDRASAVTEE